MEASKLKEILDQHRLWIVTNGVQGERADLKDADLRGASLYRADLRGASLYRANLGGANLRGANLTRANLTGAILTGTILENKAEKQPEVVSVKAESSIRSEIEAIAKKHGMKIESMTFSLI